MTPKRSKTTRLHLLIASAALSMMGTSMMGPMAWAEGSSTIADRDDAPWLVLVSPFVWAPR